MSDLEEKKYKLERWKVVLLTIAAISTFLTFFIPFMNQREQQMDKAFSEALQRLADVNPAVRASGAIDLVAFYSYRRFFGLGSSPYQRQCVFVLQNSLKIKGEEAFVRQAIIQALREINPNTMEGARLKHADLSNLYLEGISFKRADLSFSNLSRATSAGPQAIDNPASFEGANLMYADMSNTEFMRVSFKGALFEGTNMSDSRLWHRTNLNKALLFETNLTNADWEGPASEGVILEGATIDGVILIGTNLSHTRLSGAIFRNITKWDNRTKFEGADCENAQFDTTSDFYKWVRSSFPDCFK